MPLSEPIPDALSLDLLKSVAGLGSITEAAIAHRISQPAASMRLKELERTLGLTLIDRSSGRAQLTANGLAVVEWAEVVLVAIANLQIGSTALRKGKTSHLAVGASMTVAEYLVPKWLVALHDHDPALTVAITMGNSSEVIRLLANGSVNLAFVEGIDYPKDLQCQIVYHDRLVVVVAPNHPWAKQNRIVSIDQLAKTPLVLRETGSGTREVLEESLKPHGALVTPIAELSSTTAIKSAIEGRLGPAVISWLAVHDDIERGKMVEVQIEGLSLSREIRAIWRNESDLDEPTLKFLKIAKESKSAL
ncbi:LysR family transcriptional regulator [Acidithrix ferrooxidans]|uniref:HTH-type transcriptional activator CmpR n=1 Tax=Acidithrix ferrooxidans TaxID=1280514 RepID=A0A0D8HEA8_9ACTN|nr:LysR family transcriptional regulator [Acidithrix ferrooxidans]KJF16300.1 HTH-type transcriptional activator CmpR [Acidithrix ferrooxidans]